MIDRARFILRAGNGGNGSVHFRREKYAPKGGPDGGDGGRGGSIYFETDPSINTLTFFSGKNKFEANAGEAGSKRQRHGKDAQDITLKVPIGTVVEYQQIRPVEEPRLYGKLYEDQIKILKEQKIVDRSQLKGLEIDEEGNIVEDTQVSRELAPEDQSQSSSQSSDWQLFADLLEPNTKVLVAKGGKGGRGNVHFKSSRITTPRFAEAGGKGEHIYIRLTLKVLANVGLVGFPNAGKSTLLSVLTRARPKIADYPFTTLEPNLGVMTYGDKKSLVLADIPGLIEGASTGKGLGTNFLQHIERCEMLVYVVYPDEALLSDVETGEQLGQKLWEQYGQVEREVKEYKGDLSTLPRIVVLNKTDLLPEEAVEASTAFFAQKGLDLVPVSAATTTNLDQLQQKITTTYETLASD